jgi:2-polyprenyl-6-hydroxyphenyl methylase/3-demethylubiquinone-9 3-methyltransferase
MSTVRDEEIARFNRLSATWWDSNGPMRPLHVINALRLGYVLEQIAQRFDRPLGDLRGLRVADIGCGAGLMCEPLAAAGAAVMGLDAAANSIAAARLHASQAGLNIDYRAGEAQAVLEPQEQFDVLLLLEVVEHVDNVAAFVAQAAAHLAPGGLLLAATINRTTLSYVAAIVAAEYVFRLLPKGTHQWSQFVKPEELSQAAQRCGLQSEDCRGMLYLPLIHRARWTGNTSVNYIASFGRAKASAC